MHPSSFYHLRARYVFTPLYGPYSLSEALEGLISYSLNESQDSISIGSKRTLRHELISELSNVVDDLQDYLLYFSSKFLISPPDSLDFFKELRAGSDGFEPLSICWGAVISRLLTARKVVESNFWPHLFQRAINNLATLETLGQPPSFVSRQAPLNKFTFTSTSVSSPRLVSTPQSTYSLSGSQCLLPNAQSERPRTKPSIPSPTGDKEDRTSSLSLDTPTSSKSHRTRIPSNHRPPDILSNCHLQRIYKDRLNEVFTPSNRTPAAHRLCSSAPAQANGARDLGDSKDNAVEREDVTTVPCAHPHPIQLTSIQAGVTREPTMVSSRMSSPSTALRSTSTAPYVSNSTPTSHRGSSISHPRSFANASSRRPTHLSPNRRRTRHPISSVPSHCPSTVQRRRSKAQPQCFMSSPPITPPVQPLNSFQPYRDGRFQMGGKEDHALSSTFFTTPTLTGSRPSRTSLNQQPSDVVFNSCFAQTYEGSLNEVVTPTNSTVARQCSFSSTSTRISDMRVPGNLKDNAKAVGDNGQDSKGIEAAEGEVKVPVVPWVRLTSVQAEVTEEHVSVPSSSLPPSTASWSTSTPPYPFNFNPSTTFPSPRSFTNTFAGRSSNAQTRCSEPSPVHSPTTPPFQQHSFRSQSIRPPLESPSSVTVDNARGTPPPIVVYNMSDASPLGHGSPSTSPLASCLNLYQHPAPTLSRSRPTRITLNRQSSNLTLKSHHPQNFKLRWNEALAPPDRTSAPKCLCGSASAHTSDTSDLRDKAKIGGLNEQVTEEIEGVMEGNDVTQVPCASSHPNPRISVQEKGARELVAVPARALSPSIASCSTLTTPDISNPTPNLHRGSTTSFPRSFANTSPQPFTRLFSKGRHTHHPPTPSLSNLRSFSLSPPFSQQFRGRQLWRPWPEIDRGKHSSPSICQRNPSRSSSTTNPSSTTHQQQLDVRHEQARMLATHGVPTVEGEPPTTIRTSNSAPTLLTTSTSPPSVLWDPAPLPWTFQDRSNKLFAPPNHTFPVHSTCSSTSAHANDARDSGDSKDDAKIVGIDWKTHREIEAMVGEQGSPRELVVVPARTSPLSTASWSSSTAPYVSNPPLNLHQDLTSRPLTSFLPKRRYSSSPPTQDEQIQTVTLPLPDVPIVHDEGQPSSTTSPNTLLHASPHLLSTLSSQCSSPLIGPTMPARESELKATPIAHLIGEYSLAMVNISLVSSVENLHPDLIMDRGEDRNKCLPRYLLINAAMDNVCAAVTAQQIFLQRAAVLIMERKSHFIVDPEDTLMPILQGTSSLPQLYAAWKALITRIKLGVKAWEKYIAEYQLQVDAAALSSLSTLHC